MSFYPLHQYTCATCGWAAADAPTESDRATRILRCVNRHCVMYRKRFKVVLPPVDGEEMDAEVDEA